MYQQQNFPLLFRSTFILAVFVPRIRLMNDLYKTSFYAIFGNFAHTDFVERLSFTFSRNDYLFKILNRHMNFFVICNSTIAFYVIFLYVIHYAVQFSSAAH